MNIPCSMCLENDASVTSPCADNHLKKCDCCNECREACNREWHNAINDMEENDMLDYLNQQ